jgi:CubicO group peptidase (beta-lactamase class C family)
MKLCRRSALALLLVAPLLAEDLSGRFDAAVKSDVDAGRFMGAVLVARDGKTLFSKGYGFANMEWDIPNTPATKFRLGSISKQFTAACILLLEARGKLNVNDPVRKHLPDAPAAWDKITIHHVLTHTSGIPSFTSFPEYMSKKKLPIATEQLYVWFRDKPLEFQPGEKWSYSNSGYALLAWLIETVAGKKYSDFLRENVLTPAGMKDSGYDVNARILKQRAAGYTRFGSILLNADYIDMTVPSGAGGLYSTTEDLLRWEQALFGGKVVSADSLARMTTPFRNNYGYGLNISKLENHTMIGHGGGIDGFNTQLNYFPFDKVVVVVLGNIMGPAPAALARRLATLALAP